MKVEEKKSKYHLILLAKNETGYKNLVKLCSFGAGNTGGSFPQRPRITYEEIEKHSEGIIVLSACMGGELPQLILKGDIDGAREFVEYNKSLFGEDYYIEIQKHASRTRAEDLINGGTSISSLQPSNLPSSAYQLYSPNCSWLLSNYLYMPQIR